MSAWRRLFRRRPFALALAGGLLALLAGDRARLAPPPGVGQDPFEVLDQQVRNNVLIVLDTSGSMKWPVDRDSFTLGADDPGSRMFQAKQAIKAVVAANQNRVNFGLATYNILSTQKTINRNQNFEGDGRTDGPFIYVSADGQAANFYINHLCPDGATRDGFFCQIDNTFANYDGTNSADVWRSFMNRDGTNQANAYNNPFPGDGPGPAVDCTPVSGPQPLPPAVPQLTPVDLTTPANMRCRFYVQSRLIRNGTRFTWNRAQTLIANRLVATAAITCPAPPAGLVGYTSTTPICFQMQDGVGGPISTFYYTSAIYQLLTGAACGGGALITAVAPCTGNNAALVLAKMDRELPVTPAGQLSSVPAAPGNATFDYGDGHLDGDQTTEFGLRADQSTPLAGTLDFIRTTGTPAFPPQVVATQKNFVILLTDGDDTCADSNTDRAAVLAGEAAENLYAGPDFQHRAETLVVGFASAVSPGRVNVIGQAGSGRNINNGAATPAAALSGAPCLPGGACRDAFFASNTQQLIDILNEALEQATSTGFFSGTPSVFDGVPEYVRQVPPSPPAASPFEPMDPERRYPASAFRSYRASFEAGTFRGFVTGFDECGAMVTGARPVPCPTYPPGTIPGVSGNWEAGQRLIDPDRMSPDLLTSDHTFAQLLVSSSGPFPPGDLPGNPHIHRRIFTTRQNGRRLGSADDLSGATMACAGGPCRVNLWPPDPGVVVTPPSDWTNPGSLDDRLFLKPNGNQMTLADLQSAPLKACLGNSLPAFCTGTAAQQLSASQKEAREMILAFTAGAEARRDVQDQPVRDATGQIVYRGRAWPLAESTVGTPAVMIPPLNLTPTVRTQEYLLYRDGPRDEPSGQASGGNTDSFIRQGFGLRHPDRDGKEVPLGAQSRPDLKPVMSVVFVPANDMLHAFRAGPCPRAPFSTSIVASCAGETGGEELWAFVPHDLVPKLKDRMKVQTRSAHTFMLSASVRFADVFVPGAFSVSVTGKTYNLQGRWRRLLLFGRGLGGKYYTALDVTGIGSFTSPVLQTQLPAVLWNRGNPDTVDGLPGGAPVRAVDSAAYLDMGQTWSTPAVARVNATVANGNKEFVAYVGSGYSTGTNDNEGTRFYTLDPLSGDVLASDDVGDGGQPAFQNGLVANPVIYSGERLLAGLELPHPASPINESVFIGDIHGRLWKFDSTAPGTRLLFRNLGTDQPIAVAAALLNLGAPHVFVETGADVRVPAPLTGFKMFGFRDTGPPYPGGVTTLPLSPPDLGLSFPAPPPPLKGDYRGTLQPITAFQGSTSGGNGVVFFTGTRFNPPGAGCISTFDTVIFGVVGDTGGTAYATAEFLGVKAVGMGRPPVAGGVIVPNVDAGTAPAGQQPSATPVKTSVPSTPATAKTDVIRPGSTVCR